MSAQQVVEAQLRVRLMGWILGGWTAFRLVHRPRVPVVADLVTTAGWESEALGFVGWRLQCLDLAFGAAVELAEAEAVVGVMEVVAAGEAGAASLIATLGMELRHERTKDVPSSISPAPRQENFEAMD